MVLLRRAGANALRRSSNCESVSDSERTSKALSHTDPKTRIRETDTACAATLIVFVLLFAFFSPIEAQTVFWNGGANNLWSGMNWSPDTTGATTSTLIPGTASFFR